MIVERILQIIEYKGINKRKLYIETGLSNGFLDKVKDIGASKIEQILNVYSDINPEWLVTGKGNMIKLNVLKAQDVTIHNSKSKTIERRDIPVYKVQTTVAVVDLFGKNENQKPVEYIQLPQIEDCDGALYVTGDSMYPLINNGDIVIYKRVYNLKSNIIWGEMYLLCINNDGNEYFFTRFLKQSERENYIQLVSQNPDFQNLEFPLSSVKAAAIIKASIRISSQF